MGTLWLTYAWDDNKSKDVDFVAQELRSVSIDVKLDRLNVGAGKLLWEQIDDFISNPDQCDAWAIYLSQSSLSSKPCREELAYALERALSQRDEAFPLIGISNVGVDSSLLPGPIKTRLYVSTTDDDWKERVKAAVEGRPPNIIAPPVNPIAISAVAWGTYFIIELRPRAGSISPITAAVPIAEKDHIKTHFMGAPGAKKHLGGMSQGKAAPSADGKWWTIVEENEAATPTRSFYLQCSEIPSQIVFGAVGGKQQTFTPKR